MTRHARGLGVDSCLLEQLNKRNVRRELALQRDVQLHEQEGMTTDVEEVVVETDFVGMEYLAPERSNASLWRAHQAFRDTCSGHLLDARMRQRLAINLAVRR